jgi:uncharacterized repeat protein (TIGR01451 family)
MNRKFSSATACLGLLALLLSGLLTGCQTPPTQIDTGYTAPAQPTRSETQWRPASTPANTPAAPIAATRSSNVIFKSNQIRVTKTIVEQASVGGDLIYRIDIEALDDVKNVRVIEAIPTGVSFRSATPPATLSGRNPSWNFPSMRRGDRESITVTVRPTAEGDHAICSTVTVDNDFCLNFFAGQPRLEVVKKGPATIELGEEATWTVTVTNTGSATASNVVVTDTLPEAFTPTSSLRQSVGDMAPGQTETVTYTAKAVQQGSFQNQAVASYDGSSPEGSGRDGDGTGSAGASPAASAPIAVVQSGIRVRKTGPTEAYVFKPEVFEITIENTGDTDLRNVRITDILPAGSSVADNGRGRVSGNAIGWMIPTLPAGSSQLITTEIASTRKGESTNTVRLLAANGLEASDSVTTNWLAVPGVTVSITDSKDPIRVAEPTTYTIQVRNQGDFEPVSGTVTVTFSEGIKPTAVAGDAQGTINGQTVTFPRTTLEPGKDTNLSITAEGAAIGAGRAIMTFSADFLNDPIISQEATNVY